MGVIFSCDSPSNIIWYSMSDWLRIPFAVLLHCAMPSGYLVVWIYSLKSMMYGFEVVKYLSPVPLVILYKFSRTFEYIQS